LQETVIVFGAHVRPLKLIIFAKSSLLQELFVDSLADIELIIQFLAFGFKLGDHLVGKSLLLL
jgi:hypothetical protein